MAGDQGIEPQSAGPKPAVLPLNESLVEEGEGIEPSSPIRAHCFQDSFLDQPDTFLMAGDQGIEPRSAGPDPAALAIRPIPCGSEGWN